MGLLKNVAAKAHNAIQIVDSLGVIRPLKKLNYAYAGGTKQDAVAVADPEAGYQNGDTLTFPDNTIYIIAKIGHDYYKKEIIRHVLDLVLCNNSVTVIRQIVQTNNQGGVKGHVDTVIYDSLPCKILPAEMAEDKDSDVYLNKYLIFLPNTKPIELNDKLQFAHTYSVGKAEGIKLPTLGIQEITFDRDFRW